MFKGNPREPGTRSFENLQFILTDELETRLKQTKSTASQHDEWIVTYLSSDESTGLRHEIYVLENMGLIEIDYDGRLSLTPGWQNNVPHMLLNEMRDMWGIKSDTENISCVHDTIRSLDNYWEYIEGEGWRLSGESDFRFDDEEYNLRRDVFSENFHSYVNEANGIGVGDFGC